MWMKRSATSSRCCPDRDISPGLMLPDREVVAVTTFSLMKVALSSGP